MMHGLNDKTILSVFFGQGEIVVIWVNFRVLHVEWFSQNKMVLQSTVQASP